MTPLDVRLDMDRRPWTDANGAEELKLIRIGLLPDGVTNGYPAVAFMFTDEAGSTFIGWTTFRLLHAAVAAMRATPAGLLAVEETW